MLMVSRETNDEGRSTMIGTKRGFPVDAGAFPVLELSFKVRDYRKRGNIRKK